ncbi:MAG: glycosyltransferase family 9 protein [Chitinophagales bacterium]
MKKILIIKTGAAGDVVRTTSLLNVLKGNIYWVVDSKNKPLLPDNKDLIALTIEEAFEAISTIRFEQVISLEEDQDCAKLATNANTADLSGVYFDGNTINYTDNSAGWFDMSRVSKLGLTSANKLKLANTESYQFYIFKMIGKNFTGEPYKIFTDGSIKTKGNLIGVESRTGKQWPDKQWWGYEELVHQLESEGVSVRRFEQRNNIRDYLRDIAECSHIVSGDTLAMHIALAYKKNCTAIFNCTSPCEIYDYSVLKKIVSPLLNKYFYASSYDKDAVESVSLQEVNKTLPVNF